MRVLASRAMKLAVKCVAYLLLFVCIIDIVPMYMVLGDTEAMQFIYYADMAAATVALLLLRLVGD